MAIRQDTVKQDQKRDDQDKIPSQIDTLNTPGVKHPLPDKGSTSDRGGLDLDKTDTGSHDM